MLNENNLYLFTNEKQRLYFTGFFATDGYLVVSAGKSYYFLDPRYFYAARKALKNSRVQVVKGSKKEAFDFLSATGKSELFVDYTTISHAEALEYEALGFSLTDCAQEVRNEMLVKTDKELAKIKKACAIAEKSLADVLPLLKEGVTEAEIAAEIEHRFRKYGASGPSFDTIVAFGENAAVPHHETGSTKLKKNECVLIDFGCVYDGYCSDMTRTFFFGKADKEFKRAYNAVLNAHLTSEKGIYEGIDCSLADGLARSVLVERGYGELFTHSLGHGIGVNVHEQPSLSPKGKGKIENGMVFSIEPGVYVDGKFGIRIENTVVMKDGVAKPMMKTTRRLIELPLE